MGKSILNGSEIRAAVGADNLKTIRHEYTVLELVNYLQQKVYDMEICDYETGFSTEELTMLGSRLGDLLRIVADDYDMVCAYAKTYPKHKSHMRTFKGEHDEWVECE
tara:strand:+ start:97 stop:417 length:321 start_codon:yes stop_codon:yes gene_type:complete